MSFPARFALTSLAIAALSMGTASAHNTIPDDWCPVGSSVKIVGQFSYTPTQLADYKASQIGTVEGTCSTKTCGIIDDWYWANEMSMGGCGGIGLRLSQPAEAIPFVQSPADFNAEQHHDLYRFEDGVLQGICAICVSSTPTQLEIKSKF